MALPAVSAFQGTTSKATVYSALTCPKLSAAPSFGMKSRAVSKYFAATIPVRSLKPRLRHSKALGTVRIVAQSDFADNEAAKFKEGLLAMLAHDENIGEQRVPMVETCTKTLVQYWQTSYGVILELCCFQHEILQSLLSVDLGRLLGKSLALLSVDFVGWSSYHFQRYLELIQKEERPLSTKVSLYYPLLKDIRMY